MTNSMRQTRQLVSQLMLTFQDPKNPNNISIKQLREYTQKDKSLNESQIFMKKLNSIGRVDSISKQQFQNTFLPDFTNREHFSLVFDMLDQDKSGKISRRELELLNGELGLGLNKKDIQLMINFASKDGQKVYKEDLFNFFKNSPN